MWKSLYDANRFLDKVLNIIETQYKMRVKTFDLNNYDYKDDIYIDLTSNKTYKKGGLLGFREKDEIYYLEVSPIFLQQPKKYFIPRNVVLVVKGDELLLEVNSKLYIPNNVFFDTIMFENFQNKNYIIFLNESYYSSLTRANSEVKRTIANSLSGNTVYFDYYEWNTDLFYILKFNHIKVISYRAALYRNISLIGSSSISLLKKFYEYWNNIITLNLEYNKLDIYINFVFEDLTDVDIEKINDILTDICNIKNVRVYINIKNRDKDRSLVFKIKDIKIHFTGI